MQVKAIDPTTGDVIKDEFGKDKVDTLVYVSLDDAPDSSNGFPVFLESKKVSKMSGDQLDIFAKYINKLSEISYDPTNEASIKEYLLDTDNFFNYNKNAFKLTNKQKEIFQNKISAAEKAKIRKEILTTLKNSVQEKVESNALEDIKTITSVNNLRIPTYFTDAKKSIGTVTGDDFFDVKEYVYIKPPVVKINNNSLYNSKSTEGLESKRKDDNDLNVYESSYEELQSELDNILGEGLTLGYFKDSQSRHGFIDKFGNISLNFRGKKASSRALYHEISHYVSEFLLNEETQARLFDEVAKRHPEYSNWRTNLKSRKGIAEELATMSERYASERRNLKGISKYFQRFLDFLNNPTYHY